MRVFLVDRSHPGGIWHVLHPVAEALRDRGDEPVCVRMRDRPGAFTDAPEGVRVVQLDVPFKRRGPLGRADVLRQLAAFRRAFRPLLAREKPDLVHANFVLPGCAAVGPAREAGAKVVWTRHELFTSLNGPLRLLDRLARRHADAFSYVSRTVAESYGVTPDGADPGRPRHAVIHNGIDFAAVDEAVTAAAAAGPRDATRRDPDRVVCAGRLAGVKGQRRLVLALSELAETRPGARLELLGDGPDRGRLAELAESLGVADRVRFRGWTPRAEVLAAFAGAGCVAVPSDGTQEGFGLTLAEAAACGAAIAVSDIPVFREVLDAGAAGEAGDPPTTPGVAWFPPRDASALAAALATCLSGDAPGPSGAAAAGVRARFAPGRMEAGHLALYDAVMTRG